MERTTLDDGDLATSDLRASPGRREGDDGQRGFSRSSRRIAAGEFRNPGSSKRETAQQQHQHQHVEHDDDTRGNNTGFLREARGSWKASNEVMTQIGDGPARTSTEAAGGEWGDSGAQRGTHSFGGPGHELAWHQQNNRPPKVVGWQWDQAPSYGTTDWQDASDPIISEPATSTNPSTPGSGSCTPGSLRAGSAPGSSLLSGSAPRGAFQPEASSLRAGSTPGSSLGRGTGSGALSPSRSGSFRGFTPFGQLKTASMNRAARSDNAPDAQLEQNNDNIRDQVQYNQAGGTAEGDGLDDGGGVGNSGGSSPSRFSPGGSPMAAGATGLRRRSGGAPTSGTHDGGGSSESGVAAEDEGSPIHHQRHPAAFDGASSPKSFYERRSSHRYNEDESIERRIM